MEPIKGEKEAHLLIFSLTPLTVTRGTTNLVLSFFLSSLTHPIYLRKGITASTFSFGEIEKKKKGEREREEERREREKKKGEKRAEGAACDTQWLDWSAGDSPFEVNLFFYFLHHFLSFSSFFPPSLYFFSFLCFFLNLFEREGEGQMNAYLQISALLLSSFVSLLSRPSLHPSAVNLMWIHSFRSSTDQVLSVSSC